MQKMIQNNMQKFLTTIILIFSLLTALITTGCFNAVFPQIRAEVDMEEGTVNGTIHSIVRFTAGSTEYFYLENGRIYRKAASGEAHGQWYEPSHSGISYISYDKGSDNLDGVQIVKLASCAGALFALGVTYRTDLGESTPNGKKLFKSTDGTSWTEIYKYTASESAVGNFDIFCTNDTNANDRKAFARLGTSIYELTSSSTGLGTAISKGGSYKGQIGDKEDNKEITMSSCVNFDNATYFFKEASGVSGDGSTMYWTSGEYLRAATATEAQAAGDNLPKPKESVKVGYDAWSMAVCSDAIVVGTNQGGIRHVRLSGQLPVSSGTVSAKGASTITSPYRIYAMMSKDPSKSEAANAMYASVSFSGTENSTAGATRYVGLWSYYPGRGNWNRE